MPTGTYGTHSDVGMGGLVDFSFSKKRNGIADGLGGANGSGSDHQIGDHFGTTLCGASRSEEPSADLADSRNMIARLDSRRPAGVDPAHRNRDALTTGIERCELIVQNG